MVRDGDEKSLLVLGVDTTGSVGDDEGFAPEEAEDAGREGNFGERVAFIGVDATLHDGYGDARDSAENKMAGVSLNGGGGEVRNLGVGNSQGVVDLGGEAAEPGAEDDAEGGTQVGGGANVVNGGMGFAVEIGHSAWVPSSIVEFSEASIGFE